MNFLLYVFQSEICHNASLVTAKEWTSIGSVLDCNWYRCIPGDISKGTHGNAVTITGKLPERTGTAFPLFKCLITHTSYTCTMDGIANHFTAKMH